MENKFTRYHPYIINAGKELGWLPSDTKELFEKNLDKNYNLLKKYNCLDLDISYKFNKDGFRSNEFFQKDNVIFLGCSYTFGIGLPLKNTFAQIVSNTIGLECFNLALPASSNDTAFRLSYIWIKKLNPKLVILIAPNNIRFELLIHDRVSNEIESRFITTIDQLANTANKSLWANTDQNGLINKEKNILAIKHICDSLKIKFLLFDVDNIFAIDKARDLLHPGIESNKNFAHKILEQI